MADIGRRGKSDWIGFLKKTADPSTLRVQFYSKLSSSIAEFFGMSGAGVVSQFTPRAIPNAADFINVTLAANQAFGAGTDVAWDNTVSSAGLNLTRSGSQIQNLQAGVSYKIWIGWTVFSTNANAFIFAQLYNHTAAAFLGSVLVNNQRPLSNTTTRGPLQNQVFCFTPTVTTAIGLRMTTGGGAATVADGTDLHIHMSVSTIR